jgi:hypothetical protein
MVIKARRLDLMTPLLEGVLSKVTGEAGKPSRSPPWGGGPVWSKATNQEAGLPPAEVR